MFFALNDKNERVHISSALHDGKYYCPECGEKLVVKKGKIKAHHFAHPSNCIDNWDKAKNDMSEWHIAWQNKFPEEYREYVFKNEHGIHRADIYVKNKRTVIEFQHCSISNEEFNQRNKFYTQSGNILIWVFDYSEKLAINENYIINDENDIIAKAKKYGEDFRFKKMIKVNRNFCKRLQFDEKYKGISIYLEVLNKNSCKKVLLPIKICENRCWAVLMKEYIYEENFLKTFIGTNNSDIKTADEIIKETKQLRNRINKVSNIDLSKRLERVKNINPQYYEKLKDRYFRK